MASKQQRTLIPISRERGWYNVNSVMRMCKSPHFDYNYYLWYWVEFSNAKNKRRKANKLARKQRKINRTS